MMTELLTTREGTRHITPVEVRQCPLEGPKSQPHLDNRYLRERAVTKAGKEWF